MCACVCVCVLLTGRTQAPLFDFAYRTYSADEVEAFVAEYVLTDESWAQVCPSRLSDCSSSSPCRLPRAGAGLCSCCGLPRCR
jgi:hypothetical protein